MGTTILAEKANKAGVDRFIYASSGSVYGISDEVRVTEQSPLVPLTEYNKTKMVAERVIRSYSGFSSTIVRPATVCGWSPRMRLDVMVNSFVIQAMTKGVITYNGGEQYRPNIHIDDMTDLYVWLLDGNDGTYNAGFENLKISEIANMVADSTGARIESRNDVVDRRSYRLDSDKLFWAGFRPKKRVIDAIAELKVKFSEGKLKDADECYNLRKMPKAA